MVLTRNTKKKCFLHQLIWLVMAICLFALNTEHGIAAPADNGNHAIPLFGESPFVWRADTDGINHRWVRPYSLLPVTFKAGVENPHWQILVLIYSTTDFSYTDNLGIQHRVVASMTQDEKDRAANAATRFFGIDVPALTGGNMIPILTIRYPNRTLTQLDPFCGYWPSRANTASELDPAFDSVVVIWDSSGTDVNTGQPENLQQCGGLTPSNGTGQTYTTFQVDSVASNQRNIFKHEWGHSILFYYDKAGTAPKPAVSNHINDTDTRYVHCPTGVAYILQDETDDNPIPNSIYNNESGFTRDYYSGTTATPDQPARCLGITSTAWASGGPVTKPAPAYRVYLPCVSR